MGNKTDENCTKKIQTSSNLMTSRSGLVCLIHLMNKIGFSNLVDRFFPQWKSNHSYKASDFVNAVMLYLHEGGECMEDIKYISEDKALRQFV